MLTPSQDATLHRAAVRAYGRDAMYEVDKALHGWRGHASAPWHWDEISVVAATEAAAAAQLLACLRAVARKR